MPRVEPKGTLSMCAGRHPSQHQVSVADTSRAKFCGALRLGSARARVTRTPEPHTTRRTYMRCNEKQASRPPGRDACMRDAAVQSAPARMSIG